MLYIFLIIFLTLILSNCTNKYSTEQVQDVLNQSKSNEPTFAIYLVRDDISHALEVGVNLVALEGKPILTDEDINYYDWDNHLLSINNNKFIERIKKENLKLDMKPFVVTINGKNIYMGTFWYNSSSAIHPKVPLIVDFDLHRPYTNYKGGMYFIKIIQDFGINGDCRYDKRVYDTLKKLKKLKE